MKPVYALIGLGTALLAYLMRVEFAPDMGGIWLRPDSNGNQQISLGGLGDLATQPLHNQQFWTEPSLWTVNSGFYLVGGLALGEALSRLDNDEK